tara:strand:- start:10748 stop:11695 length:948 start_codon:yes stop_codon:yes gene_type:complete
MNDQEEYLISYANLYCDLYNYQSNFLSETKLNSFYQNLYKGVPLCLPQNIKYFDYKTAKFFRINKKKFSKKIFNTENLNYIGNKKYFRYGDIFAYNIKLKHKYKKKFDFYVSSINSTKKKVKNFHRHKSSVCAMQIRNVPHFGHEAVFHHLIKKFDLLILNPIFGIKKKKDFTDDLIKNSLKYIERKNKKIKFLHIWSNFHYAGPREAIHHMMLRENLGFKYFYVGRDHAGAENIYNPLAAIKVVKKFAKKFKIKPITSYGGYYCNKCRKYLIKGDCNHKNLINISGTKFRSALKQKSIYRHADNKLQKLIVDKL